MRPDDLPLERFEVDPFLVASKTTADAVAAAADALGASGLAHPIDGPGLGIALSVAMRDGMVVGTGLEAAPFAEAVRAALGAMSVEWGPNGSGLSVEGPAAGPFGPRTFEHSVVVLPATLEALGVRTTLPWSARAEGVLRRVDVDGSTVVVADGWWQASWSLAVRPVVELVAGPDGIDLDVWTRSGHSTRRRDATWSARPDLMRRWVRVVDVGDPAVGRIERERLRAEVDDRSSLASTVDRVLHEIGRSAADADTVQAQALRPHAEVDLAVLVAALGLPPRVLEILRSGAPADATRLRVERRWRRLPRSERERAALTD